MKKGVNREKRKGISLVALVIVIIVMLILSASIIITVLSDTPIEEANEAAIRTDIQAMKDKYKMIYEDVLFKKFGDETKIKDSDFEEVVPEEYKNEFIAGKDGLEYVGESEKVKEIAEDMGLGKEDKNIIEMVAGVSKQSAVEIEVTIIEGEIVDEYIYQIREKGETKWEEISSTENKMTIENLKENTEYEVKIIVKQEEKEYESEIKTVSTKEIEIGTLTMKLNDANGEAYEEGTWTKENVYVEVSGINTTYSVTGANTVVETEEQAVLENEGISTVTVKTISSVGIKTKEYKVKIDKSKPEINEAVSKYIEETNTEEITVKVIDSLSGIVAYQFSTDENLTAESQGWKIVENAKVEITRKEIVEENGIYYFYVKDEVGNITKEEIIVSEIDKDPPILESIGVVSPESGDYVEGQEITIEALYDEEVKEDNTTLKIKFGTSEERTLEKGTISGNKIIYKYLIKESDIGVLVTTSYTGTIQDKVGNELTVSNIALSGNTITAILPQLQSWSQSSTTDFHAEEYRIKITKAVLKDNVEVPGGITPWDVSKAKNGSVIAYVEDDGSEGYILTIGGKGKIYANETSSYLFNNFTALTEIENLQLLDTSKANTMQAIFHSCSSLTELDLSNFDTSKVTDMANMFSDCSSLENLNLSSFNTSQTTDMNTMFGSCSSLINVDLNNFDTSRVTNMYGMFARCSSLTNLDVSSFDTTNVTTMSNMFFECKSLTSLDVDEFNTSKVTNMAYMFRDCSSLEDLNLSNFNTSKVISMERMFQRCSNLINLNLSNFNTSQVTNMQYLFSGCSRLTNLDISNFNTSKITNMVSMFGSCSSLISLDVSSFDTSSVTTMVSMFQGCKALTNLNVSSFDTSNVTNMASMFYSCNSLTTLNLNNFDTSKVTSMYYMFRDCNNLKELDITNFNTSQVKNMNRMFQRCSSLTNLNLSNFNTSQVTDISYIFENCNNLSATIMIDNPNITTYEAMFSNAATITPAEIIVNYTEETSDLVDLMIETKSATSNVVKADSPVEAPTNTLNVEYTAPEKANIVATVNKDSEGTVTGVYITAEDENGIESIKILNDSGDVVKEIAVNNETTYSQILDIIDTGTYTVELLNSIGEINQVTFEIK